MAMPSLVPRLAALHSLRQANGGNVTITFALTTVPIMGVVGAAIDYSQANSVKTAMQAAADSTALMLARDAHSMNEQQFQTRANEYFKAQFGRNADGLDSRGDYSTDGGSRVMSMPPAPSNRFRADDGLPDARRRSPLRRSAGATTPARFAGSRCHRLDGAPWENAGAQGGRARLPEGT